MDSKQTDTDLNQNFEFVRRQLHAPPAWSDQLIKPWEKAFPTHLQLFLQAHYWTETGSINVQRVVGTDHWDYQGKTWLGFLTSGKRMQRNLQALLDNPDYYLHPTVRKPAIHYNTLDGLEFYVGADGNHRTCIARFFLAEQQKSQLHDVTLNHYQVNNSFHRTYQALLASLTQQKLAVQIHPKRMQQGREDTPGWKLDRYTTVLDWHDLAENTHLELTEAQADERLSELLRRAHTAPTARKKRWFGWAQR